jgi:hypothetical protein
MAMLEKMQQGSDIKKAINYVYCENCDGELEPGDIVKRVHYAEIQIPASERQVYYWLKRARDLFVEERGLRL